MFDYRIMEGPEAARAAVIELWGSLDGSVAPEFRGTVDACLESGIRDLVLDFGRVHFVGSAGFAEILACLERLGQDGNLLLSHVSERVLVVAEMLGLAPVLDIVADEHEAREVLWGRPA